MVVWDFFHQQYHTWMVWIRNVERRWGAKYLKVSLCQLKELNAQVVPRDCDVVLPLLLSRTATSGRPNGLIEVGISDIKNWCRKNRCFVFELQETRGAIPSFKQLKLEEVSWQYWYIFFVTANEKNKQTLYLHGSRGGPPWRVGKTLPNLGGKGLSVDDAVLLGTVPVAVL